MARTKPQRNIVRKPEVRARTGLSDSQIWRLERRGEFPARLLLSPSGMAVGWYLDEIDEFVNSRPRANGKQPPLPKSRREAEPHASDDQARSKKSNRGHNRASTQSMAPVN